MVAAYDALVARIVAASAADLILVGDSVAMVVHGHPSTVHATLDLMTLHTAAVRRGAGNRLIVADMPFLATRCGVERAVEAAGALVRAGANAVKIEGVAGHEAALAAIVGSGIPVLGHLGLTPQAVNQLGGYRVQGREPEAAAGLRRDAQRLDELGVSAIVLECVPAALATEITAAVRPPTIGIGAGGGTDGQVLVWSDLFGLDAEFRPRFARRYADGHALVREALDRFARDVRAAEFPAAAEVPA
jgi:3-methyl-2-oxobutanoate hydroxymethyltransferase